MNLFLVPAGLPTVEELRVRIDNAGPALQPLESADL